MNSELANIFRVWTQTLFALAGRNFVTNIYELHLGIADKRGLKLHILMASDPQGK